MTKTQMPEPVAAVIEGIIRQRRGADLDEGETLITTTQAEAYADARVREALERAIEACKAYERRVEATFIDNNRVQHATGAVVGASACADAIRALIPPTKNEAEE